MKTYSALTETVNYFLTTQLEITSSIYTVSYDISLMPIPHIMLIQE